MPNRNKPVRPWYRLSLTDDESHKMLWSLRLSKRWIIVTVASVVFLILAVAYVAIAYTPIRNTIPGYPDSTTRRETVRNAIVIDSLQRVIIKWEFYSDNLRRVLDGEDPVKIDSIVRNTNITEEFLSNAARYRQQDSLLREDVEEHRPDSVEFLY